MNGKLFYRLKINTMLVFKLIILFFTNICFSNEQIYMELYKGTQNIRFIYYYSDTTQHSKIIKAEYYHIEGWKNFEIFYENGKIIEFDKEDYKRKEGYSKSPEDFSSAAPNYYGYVSIYNRRGDIVSKDKYNNKIRVKS